MISIRGCRTCRFLDLGTKYYPCRDCKEPTQIHGSKWESKEKRCPVCKQVLREGVDT